MNIFLMLVSAAQAMKLLVLNDIHLNINTTTYKIPFPG